MWYNGNSISGDSLTRNLPRAYSRSIRSDGRDTTTKWQIAGRCERTGDPRHSGVSAMPSPDSIPIPDGFKLCSKGDQCVHPEGPILPATREYFYSRKRCNKTVLVTTCIECQRAYAKARRDTLSYKAYKKAYEQTAKYKAYAKAYEQKRGALRRQTPEYKAYDKAYQEKYKSSPKYQAYLKKYREEPERKKYVKNYKAKHPPSPEYLEKQCIYRRSPKGRLVASIAKHRHLARIKSLPDTFTAEDWVFALDYWGDCCAICGRPHGLWHSLALDHWIPLNSDDCPGTAAENILPLCHGIGGCNNSKGDHEPTEWVKGRLKKRAKDKLTEIENYFDVVRARKVK